MDNKEHCFLCPFCKCFKDLSSFRGIPSIKELGCHGCQNKTCLYLCGEDSYREHLKNIHNVKDPHYVKIDDQIHIMDYE